MPPLLLCHSETEGRGNLLVEFTDTVCNNKHRAVRLPRRYAPRNDIILETRITMKENFMPIIEFDSNASLEAQKAALLAQIAQLDAREPEDMNSEEYDAWAEEHEELEDLLDEIQDLLDEV